ncbi:unnamed protein product [Brachionus calyciflorus]|uniref:EF-hand domain-containing protein n=1 Tax=Brachionus calyciflorus TaxID=104777 RepID=A0A813TGU7_9BILA|nr:unnamed protein product [Brachionus calyciflorus]
MVSNKELESRPVSSISEHNNMAFDGNVMNSQTCLQSDSKKEKKQSIIGRILNTLWATRQTQDTKEDSDLLIKTTLKELIIYIVFLVIISIVTFGMTNSINYYYTNVLMNLFLEQPDSNDVKFGDIGSIDDFWSVHTGPILDGLYWEKLYNDENVTKSGFIYFENKLLGVPRLRQLRVRKGSCKVHSLFADRSTIKECYDSYSYFTEDQSPFGAYDQFNSTDGENPFRYNSSEQVKAPIIDGTFATYGRGGFVKKLGTKLDETRDMMKKLEENFWIDRGTRAVFLDFTIYNANINLFCQVRLTTEFPPTGGAFPSSTFRTVKLIRYVTPMDYFVLACEILCVIFILYYSIEEILEIRIHKLKYFKEVWNVLDVVILLICYVCIGFNIYRMIEVNSVLKSLLENTNQYPEFDSLSYWQNQFNNAIAITAFLCWIKFFKYISFNKTMTQLSSTLGRCAKDIAGFAVMFYIVFFAYAQLGYLLFGATVEDYSTFTNTLFTLFRIILGDFDFVSLESASRYMGPIYFLSYVFFVFFVLLNMFLAIINDTYSDVKSDIAEQKSDFELGQYFKRGYDKILSKMHIKKDKIADIQKAMEVADADGNSVLNFDEWRVELRKRGYADAEIEAYFSKYDQDGDRNLSAEEQKIMKDDLKNQTKKIDSDMADIKREATMSPDESDEEDNDEDDELSRKANLVSHNEFNILTCRVDTMEASIGNIVNRIDSVLSKLEFIEQAKLKRREAMARILDKLNDANNIQDEAKRAQIQKMIQQELEKWDEPLSVTPSGGLASRAVSPPSYSPNNFEIRHKSPYRQQ